MYIAPMSPARLQNDDAVSRYKTIESAVSDYVRQRLRLSGTEACPRIHPMFASPNFPYAPLKTEIHAKLASFEFPEFGGMERGGNGGWERRFCDRRMAPQ